MAAVRSNTTARKQARAAGRSRPLSPLARRLISLRKEAGLTPAEFAKIAGVHPNVILRWEGGLRDLGNVSVGPFVNVADHFDVSLNWMFGSSRVRDRRYDSVVSEATLVRELGKRKPTDSASKLMLRAAGMLDQAGKAMAASEPRRGAGTARTSKARRARR